MKIIQCTTAVKICPNCGKPISRNIKRDWDNENFSCFLSREVNELGQTTCYNVLCHNDVGE